MVTMGKVSNIADVTLRRLEGRRRRVDPAAVRGMDERNMGWLRPLNLRLVGVKEVIIVDEVRNLQGAGQGIIQERMREDLELMGGVSAVAPVFFGKNKAGIPDPGAWSKAGVKVLVDRAASAVQSLGFRDLTARFPDLRAQVVASEGGRLKPGREDEIGGNPATYLGQVWGTGKGRTLYVVVDNVDKTGATVEGGHSAVTAFLFTASPAKAIPDVRFLKIVSGYGFNPDVKDINADPELVAAAIACAAGISVDQMNATNLIFGREDRLGEPMKAYLEQGVNFTSDKDGDVMPAIASSLRAYPLSNGKPLHAMLAAAGGSSEGGLLLPVLWAGGKVIFSFASASGFKSWPTRKSFRGNEEADIREAGFDPLGTILMGDIYKDPFADGVAVFGGISDDRWIPDLIGAEAGINMAEASALSMVPQGFARIRIFNFDYVDPDRATTAGRFEPLIYALRKEKTAGEIKNAVKAWMKTAIRMARLEAEWRQDYYPVLDAADGGHRVDMEAFKAQMGQSKRYDQIDEAILSAIASETPWIAGSNVPFVSAYRAFVDMGAFARAEAGDPHVLAEQALLYQG